MTLTDKLWSPILCPLSSESSGKNIATRYSRNLIFFFFLALGLTYRYFTHFEPVGGNQVNPGYTSWPFPRRKIWPASHVQSGPQTYSFGESIIIWNLLRNHLNWQTHANTIQENFSRQIVIKNTIPHELWQTNI